MDDSFVPLTQEETLEAISQAKNGDQNAKTRLLNGHFPLIKSVVKSFTGRGVEYDDLYQLGVLGFLKAIKNFDEKFEVKFSTYSVPMVAGEIKRFLRDDGSIKVSRAMKQLASKVKAFIDTYNKVHNENPPLKLIAEKFEVDEESVVFALDASKAVLSLNAKIDENDDNCHEMLDRLLIDDKSEQVIDKIQLVDVVSKLEPRDKKIIILRYYRGKTQSEVARILGVSQVQVSRLESKILKDIKKSII